MRKFREQAIWVAIAVALSLMGYMAGKKTANHTQFVNLNQVIAVPVKLAKKSLPTAKQAAFVKAYSKALPATLAQYGKAHHVNLVVASTVYDAQEVDATEAIIAMNIQRVEHSDGK